MKFFVKPKFDAKIPDFLWGEWIWRDTQHIKREVFVAIVVHKASFHKIMRWGL